jgi:hypothetical protein
MKTNFKRISFLKSSFLISCMVQSQQLAFPGDEGYGKSTIGGQLP